MKQGDVEATNQLVQKYFERVVRAADGRLRSGGIRYADGEDIAVSVFDSLWEHAREQKFADTDLNDREGFWRLLCRYMNSKTIDLVRRERAQKRGGGHVRGESALMGPSGSIGGGLDQQREDGVPPVDQAMMLERYVNLMATLPNDVIREIVVLRMEGFELGDIAKQMDYSERSVRRKLRIARDAWLRMVEADVPQAAAGDER